ncbi:hypothetical protein ILUMI_25938 [Ignelater luminosus]|uniref:Uncharacterized protein n=1 Tax=Ignelater luminosus TaxID=2038154 RepID=A0A8K0C498_IGNLU|nr:hypothetical protein ILUMI_25938 [Ignelater luminosus]
MTEEVESVPASTSKLVDYVCDSDDSTEDSDFVISESDNSDHDEAISILRKQRNLVKTTKVMQNTVCFSTDLEKVIMLSRIDMFKRGVFCQRIIVFNECFVPVDKTQKLHPIACLWHECISGRKKEDLISTFHAFMIQMRDKEPIIIWLDNCAGQNKNWSLLSYFANFIKYS